MKVFARLLLAFSALVFAIGAYVHTSAFNKISVAVASSDLMPFAGKSLKILWLEDSIVLVVLAIVSATIAARPATASKWIIVLLALIPGATALLVYCFIGNFIGGHILIAAGIAAILGGLLLRGQS